MITPARKLEQNLGIVALTLLLVGCLVVMRPFVSALLWAVVLCYASWPVYSRLLRWVGHRDTLAALIMSLVMVLIVLVPFVIIGNTLADNVKQLSSATAKWLDAGPPDPPTWLGKVPMMGERMVEYWESFTHDSAKRLQELKRFIEPVSSWLLRVGLALGGGLVEMALSIFIAFFLFRNGEKAAARLKAVLERIGGEQGPHLLGVAGGTVRGVVHGILGTALAQGVMAGVGFLIAGVPGPALLALLTFFLSVVPVGPPLVWIPAAFWLFNQGATGWGIFLVIWGMGVSSVDNVIKPWLISQGSDMPFILIFFGVLGGAIAFGLIGVFLGPTLLAVGFRLLDEWATAKRASEDGTSSLAA